MTLYQRGKVWWYEFEFRGQRIRESAHSRKKSIAERIERERRRRLWLAWLSQAPSIHVVGRLRRRAFCHLRQV
jgi:hypothetical protein